MSHLDHYSVIWDITSEELEELAEKLKKSPILSVPITEGLEIILRRKKTEKNDSSPENL